MANVGALLLVPYVLVFAVFVIYPVVYGLWVARNPDSYVRLFQDPVFPRTVVNTLIFLLVGVNLKFLIALGLSGFSCSKSAGFRRCSCCSCCRGRSRAFRRSCRSASCSTRSGFDQQHHIPVVRH